MSQRLAPPLFVTASPNHEGHFNGFIWTRTKPETGLYLDQDYIRNRSLSRPELHERQVFIWTRTTSETDLDQTLCLLVCFKVLLVIHKEDKQSVWRCCALTDRVLW